MRIFENIKNFMKMFGFFWPTLIGLFDKIGDVIYANQCFADEYLRNMFLFFLICSLSEKSLEDIPGIAKIVK